MNLLKHLLVVNFKKMIYLEFMIEVYLKLYSKIITDSQSFLIYANKHFQTYLKGSMINPYVASTKHGALVRLDQMMC